MNKRQRGRNFEFWCRDFLKNRGFFVHLAGKKALKVGDKIIFKGDDIFGLFDLIAVKPEELKFIQCSLHSSIKKRTEETRPLACLINHASVELWIKRETGQIDIFKFNGQDFILDQKIIRGKLYELNNKGVRNED